MPAPTNLAIQATEIIDPADLASQVIITQSNLSILECVSVVAACCAGLGAIAASIIAFIAYKQNKAPNVVAYLQTNNDAGTLGLVTRNIGNGCAYDITLNGFDSGLVDPSFYPKVQETFISNGISMLAPNQQRDTTLCSTDYARSHYMGKTSELTVSWKKKPNALKTVTAKFALDYTSFANSLYVKSDIHLIRKDLDNIYNSLSKLANKNFPGFFMSDDGIRQR